MKNIRLFLMAGFYCLVAIPAPAQAQAVATGNVPSKTYSRVPIASGPAVLGVFEGRFPCQELARQLQVAVTAECTKLKWRLTLFRDPATGQPATYKLEGSFYRDQARTGPWTMVRGTPGNPRTVVYQLDPDKPPGSLLLLKGDDNVLFMLDQDRNLRVGTDYLSYTFNRVR
jgi:hypothetical protein